MWVWVYVCVYTVYVRLYVCIFGSLFRFNKICYYESKKCILYYWRYLYTKRHLMLLCHVNSSCLTSIGILPIKLLIYCCVLKFFFLLMTLSMEHATDRPASARNLPSVEANFMANFMASFLPKTLSRDAAVA